MTNHYNIGIIGGGPAGYTAALNADAKNNSVIIFEKECLGGVCLNKGCIPTKAILHSAELYDEIKCAQDMGILVDNVSFDYEKVVQRKEKVVERLKKSLELAVKNSGVKVINTEAKLISKNEIEADGEKYIFDKVIVAAGSSPRSLKGMEFDHKFILNSDDILQLKKLPESIVIIGSGAIGIEWARIMAAFDVEVTIVEAAEHLLPLADIEVSKRLERIFKAKKIKMYLKNSVEKIDSPSSACGTFSNNGEKGKVVLSSGEILNPDCVLLAVGRKPNDINRIDGVSYIGDVCGSIQLAHFAIKQALDNIKGIEFNEELVPAVVYGNPEIAWAGKREQDLEAGSYEKANLLISALGKSHCDNCSDGFIKVLYQNGKIVGAHIVSKEASSLIQQIVIAIQNNIPVKQLREVCFAHPTYSEGIFECLMQLD